MAGASVIHRETTMSAVSISRPIVFAPRPYSSRVQSARLLISQKNDYSTNRGCLTNEPFPDIQRLNISQATGSSSFSNGVTESTMKESNFTNFRLLQRLAASAKARISNNSINSQTNLASPEAKKSKWTNPHLHISQGDIATDAAYATVPPLTELQRLPPAKGVKDTNRTYKAKRSRSRKRRSKFKARPSTKQSISSNDETASDHLQPATSKVIPTFSHRFTKQRRRQQNTRVPESSNETGHLQFSLAGHSEYFNKPNLNINSTSKGSDDRVNGNVMQEAKLRAIYESSKDSNSSTTDGAIKIKLRKIFQSEKQSGYITQCGRMLPCAPPTSPTPLVLDRYEIVPSLADLTSQQSIKQRLAALEKENKKKRQVQDQEKKQKEKNVIQTQFEIQRARTRQEIYALNKIMTKLEKEHFKRFHEKMKNR
ncbi:uncharacterized protein [Apostichopus japonicus]|uniref:uncharacterized protein n=1 Tax=Stichopus japonicus TaxID=307972 RepID=UPI003AB42211